MEFVDLALDAQRRGDQVESRELFRQAFDRERAAAESVASADSNEPTRSILLRSAAALALDCGEDAEAERLIATALAGNPPEKIEMELRELLKRIACHK